MPVEESDQRISSLYETHYHEILAYCMRRVGFNDAEDVASEVFTVAWRRRDEIEFETARAWLFGIARRVVANSWRSAFRRRRLQERIGFPREEAASAADVYFARNPGDDQVMAALGKLRANDREILMLAAWEELTGPEIAQALGISVSAAEQRLHRAKQRLSRAMRPVGEPEIPSRAATEEGGC